MPQQQEQSAFGGDFGLATGNPGFAGLQPPLALACQRYREFVPDWDQQDSFRLAACLALGSALPPVLELFPEIDFDEGWQTLVRQLHILPAILELRDLTDGLAFLHDRLEQLQQKHAAAHKQHDPALSAGAPDHVSESVLSGSPSVTDTILEDELVASLAPAFADCAQTTGTSLTNAELSSATPCDAGAANALASNHADEAHAAHPHCDELELLPTFLHHLAASPAPAHPPAEDAHAAHAASDDCTLAQTAASPALASAVIGPACPCDSAVLPDQSSPALAAPLAAPDPASAPTPGSEPLIWTGLRLGSSFSRRQRHIGKVSQTLGLHEVLARTPQRRGSLSRNHSKYTGPPAPSRTPPPAPSAPPNPSDNDDSGSDNNAGQGNGDDGDENEPPEDPNAIILDTTDEEDDDDAEEADNAIVAESRPADADDTRLDAGAGPSRPTQHGNALAEGGRDDSRKRKLPSRSGPDMKHDCRNHPHVFPTG